MIGGIYGDLAATTYLHRPEVFYKQLFDEKATLSEYGLSIIATYALLTREEPNLNIKISRERINKYFKDIYNAQLYISPQARAWAYDNAFRYSYVTSGMLLNRLATLGYFKNDHDKNSWIVVADQITDKEDGYARILLPQMIHLLRQGKTKDEVYKELPDVFSMVRHNWNWKEQESTLCLLMRAWDCFYNSFDFGSAIHNAVRYPNSNTRQLASLTGLIAEAFYGCAYYFTKKCFQSQNHIWLDIPQKIKNLYPEECSGMVNFYRDNKLFYPKNNALTNVERHTFTPINSIFNSFKISKSSYQKIKVAFFTDWDNRYGIYLDNGWFYCYRSFYVMGRYRIRPLNKGFMICDVQQSEEKPKEWAFDTMLQCAFESANISEIKKLSHF